MLIHSKKVFAFWLVTFCVGLPFAILAAINAGPLAAIGVIAVALVMGYCYATYGG